MGEDKTTLKYTLSIRINTDGFCFCSYIHSNPESMQYTYYQTQENKSIASNFEKAWQQCKLNDREFDTIQVIITDSQFSIIPNEYDKKSEHPSLLTANFPHLDTRNNEILSNKLPAYNVTILFALDKALYKRLCELGNVTYYSSVGIVLSYLTKYERREHPYLVAFYHRTTSLILGVSHDRVLLANNFTSQHESDQLYYLLSIWNELKFSQREDTLLLCGDNSVEKMLPIIKQFIHKTMRINSQETFHQTLINKLNGVPFDLQILILCE